MSAPVFDLSQILWGALVPVLFGLALGYYAGARGRIDNKNVASLNVALMQFILPCSLFLGVGRTSGSVLLSQSSLLVTLTVVMAVTYTLAFVVDRRIVKDTRAEASVQALTVSFPNNVAVGLPLLAALYGTQGQLAVAAAIITGVLIVSPITLVLLESNSLSKKPTASALLPRLGSAALATLRRPVVLAPFCALLFPLSGHTLPAAAVSTLDLVGKATIGVALFLTGLILSAQPIRLSSGVAYGVFLKNVAQPALFVPFALLFRLHGTLAREAFILTAIPAGFFGTVFGARYGISSREASSTLVLSTLASIITLPLAVFLSAYLP